MTTKTKQATMALGVPEQDATVEFLRANAEALCSRMMAAMTPHESDMAVEVRRVDDGYWAYRFEPDFEADRMNGYGNEPHDAVLALFLRVCCDPEDI